MTEMLEKFYQDDRFAKYYNLISFNSVFLTTDIDWAPDFAVEELFNLVQEFDFKLTAFATHKSTVMQKSNGLVEVGLHPDNTRPDKEFGFSKKIEDLKSMYPESVGLRCHRNFFGNNIGDLAKRAGLKYDASTLLWLQPFCSAFEDYNNLIRMSYYWEDGIHCDKNLAYDVNKIKLHTPGLKILNVHPILIYLNAPNDQYRKDVTKNYSDLTTANYTDITNSIYKGYGIKNFYLDILTYLKLQKVNTHFLRELV